MCSSDLPARKSPDAIGPSLGPVARRIDVIAALGTHQPMTEEQFCQRLEITAEERRETYGRVQFFNHEWDNPQALRRERPSDQATWVDTVFWVCAGALLGALFQVVLEHGLRLMGIA